MPQNAKNYTRYDPPYHFVLLPLLALNLIYHAVDLLRHLGDGAWMRPLAAVVLAFALVLLALKARLYPLKVQDRVIRLEERLRLATLLPESLRARIPQLSESQLIALRFASDGEVAELVRATLERNLDSEQIKAAIRTWRPDEWRV
jgi:hypothetical protein